MQELRTQWTVAAGGAIIGAVALIFDPTEGASAGVANPAPVIGGQEARPGGVTTPVRPPAAAIPAAPDPRWEVVRKLLRSAQYPSAEEVARAMVKERPDDLRAGFYLGLALHKEKRHGEALAYLERASAAPADSFPEAAHAVHYLGWCRYYLGDLPGARAAFTTHANAFPNYDDTQFALGLIAYEEDRVIESEAYFRRALKLLGEQQGAARERAKNLARLGDVLLRQDRLPEAEQCYRQAVELFETHGEAWSKLARARSVLWVSQRCTVGHKDVHVAIVIEVNEGQTAALYFNNLRGWKLSTGHHGINTTASGGVFKSNGCWRSPRWRGLGARVRMRRSQHQGNGQRVRDDRVHGEGFSVSVRALISA